MRRRVAEARRAADDHVVVAERLLEPGVAEAAHRDDVGRVIGRQVQLLVAE